MNRPLDVLGSSEGKRVIVILKNGSKVVGTLKAFDSHINIWLDDAEIQSEGSSIKFGTVLVRGDNIILVSPSR